MTKPPDRIERKVNPNLCGAGERTDMKPNCYDCKWRGNLPGDAHSCCNHPKVKPTKDDPLNAILGLLAAVGRIDLSTAGNPLGVTGSKHGIRKGWFSWPMNFDPIWLETCDGFEKEGGEIMNPIKDSDSNHAVSPTTATSATNTTN